uniref:Odorant receptor n=1 Tax=Hedya nubiferana TaxID=572853 RepID=A0A223HD37_9NEOP|nr:putative odorant receptor OR58 [Hedya nubiferana]
MTAKTYTYKTNDTVLLFHKICNLVYLGCGTNFMFHKLKLPTKFIKTFNHVSKIFEMLSVVLICSEWGAFVTQKNLTLVQKTDLFLFGPTSITLYVMYWNGVYRKGQIKDLSFTLAVTLKEMFCDSEIEKKMIKKTWRFVVAMVCIVFGFLLATGINNGYRALTTNATFTTMLPVWPSLEDHSKAAGICRVVHYIVWWIFVTRVTCMYFIILAIAICLQHQFRILHEYFLSLPGIFDGEGSQEEKERKFEDRLKHGIKMHSLTLWCTDQTQLTCGVAFSTQVITNVLSLVLLMVQWMNMERTFGNAVQVIMFANCMLIGTGIFMWNAGDITFEAAKLPTAMFHSGWHNCRGQSAARVRKLLTIAMRQAQDRVVIKGLGIIELSYESYISIVKSSYSVFSVMY